MQISLFLTTDFMDKQILLLFLIAALGFNACSEKCDEPDIEAINGLYFELQQGGEGGFTD